MFLRVLLTCAVFISVTSKREYVNSQDKHENIYLQIWPKPKPYPFLSRMVSESLNLTCRLINDTDLVSAEIHNLSWRIPLNLINSNRIVPFKLNDGIIGLQFLALEENDSGEYTCVSDTFNLKSTTRLVVKPFIDRNARKAYCSERMFVCPDGLCILERFVCDGRADCPFGADEHSAHCGDNVCVGKIQCNDGRCIPREWCCTKRDVNCTTKVRPDCCDEMQPQVYQEFEGSYLSKPFSKKPNDMDFLHMTIYTIIACALALTIIVLVLVMMLCKAHFREPQCCRDPGDTPQHNGLYASAFNLTQLLSRYDRVPYRDHQPQCDITGNNDSFFTRILCCKTRRDMNRAYVTPMLEVSYDNTVLGQPRFYRDQDDDHDFIGQPISPPPYSETLQIPPKIGPPPPYMSVENIVSDTSVVASSSICDSVCDNRNKMDQPGTSGTNNSLDDMMYIDCDSENDSLVENRNSNDIVVDTTASLIKNNDTDTTSVTQARLSCHRSLGDLSPTSVGGDIESSKCLTRSENCLTKLEYLTK